jgi:hypothetical protein
VSPASSRFGERRSSPCDDRGRRLGGSIGLALAPILLVSSCNAILGHDYPTYDPGADAAAEERDLRDGGLSDLSEAEVDAEQDVVDDVLVDPSNCGRIGHPCLGGQCIAGMCQPIELTSGDPKNGDLLLQGIYSIAPDYPNVYFTSWGITAPALVVTYGQRARALGPGFGIHPSGTGIAFDATSVYYGNYDQTAGTGMIERVDKVGGSPVPIAPMPGEIVLAVDDTYVFYVAISDPYNGLGAYRVDKASDQTVELYNGNVCGCIAMDGSSIYFAVHDGDVMRVRKDGSGSQVLCNHAGGFNEGSIAVDATNVYFTDFKTKAVYSVPVSGGQPSVLVSLSFVPLAIAVDDQSVYFTTIDEGTVGAVDKDGTHQRGVAYEASGRTTGIAVDSKAVYWGGSGGNPSSVWMIAK